jgi:vanillate O-demethylase monooxygenase subunit
VVAALGHDRYACLPDRCLHRSTRLSIGWVDDGAIRCAYHGWRWAADGRCVEIPSMPGTAIPSRACQPSYQIETRYGLLWARLRSDAPTQIPACPAWDDPTMRLVPGQPYSWPVAAPRRVENFTDLAHFAWVHDGSLGRRDEPVPPVPEIRRHQGELRFDYTPPPLAAQPPSALTGASAYRMPMPATVNIDFEIAGRPGVRRHLWMTASPVDAGTSRTFWLVARNDGHDQPDDDHLAFQALVLAEDEPVVANQDPPEIPLEPGAEISVKTDRVSIEYRRWLNELAAASPDGPDALSAALGLTVEPAAR